MTVMTAPRDDVDERVDQTFIELICTVDALVEAEFEELARARRVGCPPTERPDHRGPHLGVRGEAWCVVSTGRSNTSRAGVAASERSPPPGPHPAPIAS